MSPSHFPPVPILNHLLGHLLFIPSPVFLFPLVISKDYHALYWASYQFPHHSQIWNAFWRLRLISFGCLWNYSINRFLVLLFCRCFGNWKSMHYSSRTCSTYCNTSLHYAYYSFWYSHWTPGSGHFVQSINRWSGLLKANMAFQLPGQASLD